MRSTTKTDFPIARSHIRAQDLEALDKLEYIAREAQNAGRRLERAVRNLNADGVEDALYHLSSLGSVVNTWSE